MMEKILNQEIARYNSNLSTEEIHKKLKALLEEAENDFDGKITTSGNFEAYSRRNVIGWNMPGLKRKAAYLKGKFSEGENGTRIELNASPNASLPLFGFIAIPIGLVMLILGILNHQSFLIWIGVFFVLLGLFYHRLSTYFRRQLMSKFVKVLGVRKI